MGLAERQTSDPSRVWLCQSVLQAKPAAPSAAEAGPLMTGILLSYAASERSGTGWARWAGGPGMGAAPGPPGVGQGSTLSRARWLATHAAVVATGLVVIVVGSSLVLALSTAWSVGNTDEFGATMTAGLEYLPAELVPAALALALFALWPRGFALIWAAYAMATFIALLGPGLKLAQWILDLAPTAHVGNPPLGTVDMNSLATLAIVAIALALVALAAFRRRNLRRA